MKNNKEILQKLLGKIKEIPDNIVEDSINDLSEKLAKEKGK